MLTPCMHTLPRGFQQNWLKLCAPSTLCCWLLCAVLCAPSTPYCIVHPHLSAALKSRTLCCSLHPRLSAALCTLNSPLLCAPSAFCCSVHPLLFAALNSRTRYCALRPQLSAALNSLLHYAPSAALHTPQLSVALAFHNDSLMVESVTRSV